MATVNERREAVKEYVQANPLTTANELYDWMVAQWPDVTRGGHRGLVGRMYPDGKPWEGVSTSCPKCKKVVHGLEECLEAFGTRYGGTQFQSWCRDCR